MMSVSSISGVFTKALRTHTGGFRSLQSRQITRNGPWATFTLDVVEGRKQGPLGPLIQPRNVLNAGFLVEVLCWREVLSAV